MRFPKTRLIKAAKSVYDKYHAEIKDIILFGSVMKGKEKPRDIDILIIFNKKVDKAIESYFKAKLNLEAADINSTTLEEFKSEGFIAREGVYLEGLSLINNELMSESIGFASIAFVKYALDNIKGSRRIRFYYALQGRNKAKGFLSEVGAKRYSKNVIICEYYKIEMIKPFFEQWKIEYTITPALVPKRLKHILLNSGR